MAAKSLSRDDVNWPAACSLRAGKRTTTSWSSSSVMPGRLYVVSTPIGNLRPYYGRYGLLKEVDWIACEDTRRTGHLLHHYGITTRTISYHEHNEAERAGGTVRASAKRRDGRHRLDAGTPLLSDPGYRIVHGAVEAGIKVEVLPGPSALLAALVVSGLPTDQFHFGGFLPARQGQRIRLLETLAGEAATLIFYEAPGPDSRIAGRYRVRAGTTRDIVVARELTKLHEEVLRGPRRVSSPPLKRARASAASSSF